MLRLGVSVSDGDALWDGDSEGDISRDAEADEVAEPLEVPVGVEVLESEVDGSCEGVEELVNVGVLVVVWVGEGLCEVVREPVCDAVSDWLEDGGVCAPEKVTTESNNKDKSLRLARIPRKELVKLKGRIIGPRVGAGTRVADSDRRPIPSELRAGI